MTENTQPIGRRPVLKGAGVTLGALGGLSNPVAAKGGNNGNGNGGGRKPLEDSPSFTAAYIWGVSGTLSGFPYPSAASTKTFDRGFLFDTTSAEITPSGNSIHFQLQFGADSKPYVLVHEGDGEYTPRGAVINFELGEDNRFGVPPGKYRATVRESVNLYEKGGNFNWSVTRTDLFFRQGMKYAGSSLIVVWDEDGEDNNSVGDRNPQDGNPLTGTPEFSSDILGEEVYEEILETGHQLVDAGPSNPGGQ